MYFKMYYNYFRRGDCMECEECSKCWLKFIEECQGLEIYDESKCKKSNNIDEP